MPKMKMILLAMFLITGMVSSAQAQDDSKIYVVTGEQRINARACPQLSCEVVQTFTPGEELTVTEVIQGDTVSGSDQWLHVILDGDDVYVHSSLATAIDPAEAEIYFNQGNVHLHQGEYALAIADYDKAIRLNPDFVPAYHFRGFAYYSLGEYEQAIDNYSHVIELDPNNALAYEDRGNTYDDLGEYEQALADYTQAVMLNPDDPDIYFNRAIAYYRQGEYEQAIADFDEAIRLNPEDAAAYNMRAYANFHLGDVDQAIADVSIAIQLQPNEPGFLDSRCEFYLKSEQWALGIADCEAALALGWEFSEEMQVLLDEARQQ